MTLQLPIPAVVTARALATAIDRALPTRTHARRDLALATGIAQVDVSRAANASLCDTTALTRVAALAGYERHPHRPGYYRRAATVANADPKEA